MLPGEALGSEYVELTKGDLVCAHILRLLR